MGFITLMNKFSIQLHFYSHYGVLTFIFIFPSLMINLNFEILDDDPQVVSKCIIIFLNSWQTSLFIHLRDLMPHAFEIT